MLYQLDLDTTYYLDDENHSLLSKTLRPIKPVRDASREVWNGGRGYGETLRIIDRTWRVHHNDKYRTMHLRELVELIEDQAGVPRNTLRHLYTPVAID